MLRGLLLKLGDLGLELLGEAEVLEDVALLREEVEPLLQLFCFCALALMRLLVVEVDVRRWISRIGTSCCHSGP